MELHRKSFLRSLIEADRARQIKQEIESQLLEAANGPFSEWNEADIGDIREAGLRLIDRRARQ